MLYLKNSDNTFYSLGLQGANSYHHNNWNFAALSTNSSNSIIKSNSVTSVGGRPSSNVVTTFSIGGSVSVSNCRIAQIAAWDRDLSVTELGDVYNIMKTRYGIT